MQSLSDLLNVDSNRVGDLAVHRYNRIGFAKTPHGGRERHIDLVETGEFCLCTSIENGYPNTTDRAGHISH